jgi:general secretion pathway protein J
MMVRSRQSGFTLLELLISLAMIGLIVLIVTGAMRLSFRSVASGEKRIDQLERLRTTAGLIDAQIQSLFSFTTAPDGTLTSSVTGESEALGIATNYSLWKGQAGYVQADYKVTEGTDGKKVLTLSEHTVGVEDAHEAELLGGFEELRFSYYAKEVAESEGGWKDSWNDEDAFPDKIRIVMKKGGRDMSITIPLRLKGPNEKTQPTVPDEEDD